MNQRYKVLEKLGSGTYGTVYKACDTVTGECLALKKINIDLLDEGFPQSYLREVSLLKSLRHLNIVDLKDICWEENNRIYLVFEYMMFDLFTYICSCEPNGINLTATQNYFYQIVSALEFCHKHAVIHRDLKPENVLIDGNGVVKIADFGLSRTISVPSRAYSTHIVTLWYRAPELLLGRKSYAFEIDIWSLGCIFVEMVNGMSLFTGDSEIDQIRQIFSILGTPNEDMWPGVTSLKNYSESFPEFKESRLQTKVILRGAGFQLLEQMLTYNPSQRISAKKILKHQYFRGFDSTKRYKPMK